MAAHISPWIWTLRKWWALFAICFQESMAYRASMLIWVLTDVAPAVTMPLVWAKASHGGSIAGYSRSDFVIYYLAMLLIGCFVTSHLMWDVASEIKEGQFSTALVRPIGYFQVNFFRNLSWRVLRVALFAPFFLVIFFCYQRFLGHVSVGFTWQFWMTLLLGHTLSLVFTMMMAMLALFTQEVYSVFELYYGPMLFLSGQTFPVAVLPNWAINLAKVTPFYYTTGLPTEVLIGRIPLTEAPKGIVVQVIWIFISFAGYRQLWRRGLKHYTGVGM